MVGLVAALVMLEPDLGTTVMISVITGTLFFIAGARLVHVIALAGSGIFAATLLILTGGYRMDRILSFTSAEEDPTGVGFQTLQLLVAFGSGGVWGLGLGVSRQKFFYVPGSHTDGVLAIIGEEIGFVGVLVVLSLFLVLFWRAWLIMRRAPDLFGSLIAAGVLAWFAFQLLLNVGGVTRLIPLTGIPLPFLSAGGSSLLVSLVAIGLLLSVSRYAAFTPEPERPRGVQRRAAVAVGGSR
jgi:cell division protein FtsW